MSLIGDEVSSPDFLPLVSPDMFLKVIFATESLATGGTRVRSDACVDELVSGEFLVAGECLVAGWVITGERSLASVDSNMVLELTVVREGHPTDGTLEVLRPELLGLLRPGFHR